MIFDLLHRFVEFNEQKSLFQPGEKIGLAVSGGLDSVVLFDLFKRIYLDWRLEIIVLHLDHGLRLESVQDAEFVAGLCKEAGISFISERLDVASRADKDGLSIETAARECRYGFFKEVIEEHHLDKVAIAHTASDQAETVLAYIMRGTGLNGLQGMPVKRGHIIRPLLFAERKEMQQYAEVFHLDWRKDASNDDTKFTRNRIRHRLLPLIQEQFNPQIVKALNRLCDSVSESEHIVQQAAAQAAQACLKRMDENKIVLEIDRFLTYLKSLQRLVLRHVLEELGADPKKLTHNIFSGFIQFLQKRASGSCLEIIRNVVVVVSGNEAVFETTAAQDSFELEIGTTPGRFELWSDLFLEIKQTTKPLRLKSREKNSVFIDADRLSAPLLVRTFRDADYFYPVNGVGKRKVSDYFIDHKVPFYDRRNVPILECGGAIVWICGLRLDDRFKVTKNTVRVFKLTIGKRERKNNF